MVGLTDDARLPSFDLSLVCGSLEEQYIPLQSEPVITITLMSGLCFDSRPRTCIVPPTRTFLEHIDTLTMLERKMHKTRSTYGSIMRGSHIMSFNSALNPFPSAPMVII